MDDEETTPALARRKGQTNRFTPVREKALLEQDRRRLQLGLIPPPVHVLNVLNGNARARSVDEALRVRTPFPHLGELRVELVLDQVLDQTADGWEELEKEESDQFEGVSGEKERRKAHLETMC